MTVKTPGWAKIGQTYITLFKNPHVVEVVIGELTNIEDCRIVPFRIKTAQGVSKWQNALLPLSPLTKLLFDV
jgi:hypothetical protein